MERHPDGDPCSRKIVPLSYAAFRDKATTGMIALCRPSSIEGQVIAVKTGGPYSHATMLGYAGKALMLGETRQWWGTRLISARREFLRWSGYYDVYQFRSRSYRADDAWTFVCHAAGGGYGWRHLARCGLRMVSRRFRAYPNSDDPEALRDCSELIHAAACSASLPRLFRYDQDVTPNCLADVRLTRYLCTVVADDAAVKAVQAAQARSFVFAE